MLRATICRLSLQQLPGKGSGTFRFSFVHEYGLISQMPLGKQSGVAEPGMLAVAPYAFGEEDRDVLRFMAAGRKDCDLLAGP